MALGVAQKMSMSPRTAFDESESLLFFAVATGGTPEVNSGSIARKVEERRGPMSEILET
jgi:hypothetical protein